MCYQNTGALFISVMLRSLSGRCSNSWQASDKQPIASEAMIFNLNNGTVLHWAAEFILTSRYDIGRVLRSLWNPFATVTHGSWKPSLEQRELNKRDREGERGDCRWKWLTIINCISTGSSAHHLPPVGNAPAWWSNHPLLSKYKGLRDRRLGCCKRCKNYNALLRVNTKGMASFVFKLASVFQTPFGHNCLPQSVARRPHLPQLSLSTVCGWYCCVPPPPASTASPVLVLQIPTLVNEN